MSISRFLAISLSAIALGAVSARAQTPLPEFAQLQVLLVQAEEAISRGDEKAALQRFAEMSTLKNVTRPSSTYILEARLAGRAGDWPRTVAVLEAYFGAASQDDADVKVAAELYAIASERKKEVDAKIAAERVAAEAAAAAAKTRDDAEKARLEALAVAEKVAQAEADARQRRSAFEAWAASASESRKIAAAAAGMPEAFRDCAGCPEMMVLPGGKTEMAGPGLKTTTVTLRSFAVSKFEITWDEWELCVKERGCNTRLQNQRGGDAGWGRGRKPVINVDHADATSYVTWLSKKTRKTYKLLSESQWQYAAVGVSEARYPWGDEPPACDRNQPNSAASPNCNLSSPAPVGSYQPNPFGLHDMAGNVFELLEEACVVLFAGKLQTTDVPIDGAAHTGEARDFRNFDCYYVIPPKERLNLQSTNLLFRGGSFLAEHTSRDRITVEMDNWGYQDTGFRVARVIG